MKSDNPLICEEALTVLSEAGAAARMAAPDILKLTHYPNAPLRAAADIGSIDPDPYVFTALRHPSVAADRPGSPSRPAGAVGTTQRRRLSDPVSGGTCLRAIGGDSAIIVPAVLEAAKQDARTRPAHLLLLADSGAQSAAAVPWLVAELRRQPSS